MTDLLRDALIPSGLFLQGTEHFSSEFPVNAYYGFNVTKTAREPIDQIHGFIAARRIQDRNRLHGSAPGSFIAFVGGEFEALNTRSADELEQLVRRNRTKETEKKTIFRRILTAYQIDGEILVTQDLWQDDRYWTIFAELIESGRFTRGSLTQDTLKWFGSVSDIDEYLTVSEASAGLMAMGSKITHKIGTWRAPIIYTPIEVAEAVFLQQAKKIRCKIGHMEETVYDKYIISVMDVVHLRQPTDFRSSRLKPRTVTPYIDKERREPNIRIYFDDTIDSIVEKIGSVPSDDYVFTIHPDAGEVLNPIIDKAVLAVESARCMNLGPIKLAGTTVSSGSHLIHAVAAREISVRDIAKDLPGVLFDNLVSPFTRTQEVRA